MPQPALDAIFESYQYVQRTGPFSTPMFKWMFDELKETRTSLAEEFGGKPESYALTGNVTEGCNIVLWGIDWQPGDNLLLSDSEHSGVIGAAENIARRLKLELTYFPVANKSDAETVEGLKSALRPKTKLVLFSHALWNTAQVLPVEAMLDVIHQHGAQALVDGAQTAGAIEINLTGTKIDYYAITGHKWVCGPEGIGALFIREDRLSQLLPTFVGWRMDMTGGHGGRPVDGSRFEVATSAFPLFAGLRAALKFHRAQGSAAERSAMVMCNAADLREKLSQLQHVQLFGGQKADCGLVSFTVQGGKHSTIAAELESRNLMLRTIPSPDALRASTHYFTSPDEISALTDALSSLRV
jgi:L-cysteine/cystine lyase